MSLTLRRRASLLASATIALLVGGLLTASPAAALPPTITITKTQPNGSGWNNTDVSVSLRFNQRVNAVATLSGATVADYGMEEGNVLDTFTIANEGTTKVSWSAMNGLDQESKGDFTVRIDKTAPVLTSSTPQEGKAYLRYTTTMQIAATCADGASGVATCASVTPGTTHTPMTSGSRTWDFAVSDLAGNTAVRTVGYVVVDDPTIDNAAPVITVEGATPSASGWYRTPPSLTVRATDASRVDSLSVALPGGATVVAPAGEATVQLPAFGDGSHAIAVSAMDHFINCGYLSATVRVDSTVPTASLQGVTGGEQVRQNTSRSITPTCADSGSGVASCSMTIDNAPLAAGSALPTTAVGPHTLRVNALDTAGNSTTTATAYTVTEIPDTTPPTVTSITPRELPDASGWHRGTLTLDATGADTGAGATGVARIEWRYAVTSRQPGSPA